MFFTPQLSNHLTARKDLGDRKLPRLDLHQSWPEGGDAPCSERSVISPMRVPSVVLLKNLTAAYTTLGTSFVIVAILVVDKVGRRTLFRKSNLACLTPSSRTTLLINLLASHRLPSSCSLPPGRGVLAIEISRFRQYARSSSLPDLRIPLHRLLPMY